jgi:hypothetical protein
MRMWTQTLLVVVGIALVADRPAFAQAATVQQPVVSTMSVGTTVSVPDRGSMFLGGVSRAGAARRSVGPFRSGTSTGVFREQSGLRVAVRIHDFEAMDRALLDAPIAAEPRRTTGRAAQAYRTLTEAHRPGPPIRR